MRKNATYALVAAGLVLCLPTALAGKPPPTATVLVDCTDPDPTKHDSVNGALETPAGKLIIEIRGMCREKVVVERKNVTLRGADPMTDGITGPVLDPSDPNDRALVTVRGGVRGILFESLGISESQLRGLELVDISIVEVKNCRITGNWRGLQVAESGGAGLTDTEIANDTGFQLLTWGHGTITCTRCTINAPHGHGVAAIVGGRIGLTDSSVTVGGVAVQVEENGYFRAEDTNIAAGSWAAYAGENSAVLISSQDAGSPPEISGSVWAQAKSMVWLEGITQTANPLDNYVSEHSNLNLLNSTLVGLTHLTRFSNGTAEGGSALGDLVCARGADFFCDDPAVNLPTPGSTSNCGQCLKP